MDKVKNVFILCEIRQGVYGILHAWMIENKNTRWEACKTWIPTLRANNSLWKHQSIKVIFFLTVDNFGVEYFWEKHATHLVQVLQKWYKIDTDWEGNIYCGFTLGSDYNKRPRKNEFQGSFKITCSSFKSPDIKTQKMHRSKHIKKEKGLYYQKRRT